MSRKVRWALILAMTVMAAGTAVGYYHVNHRSNFDPEELTRYYAALRVPPAQPVDTEEVRAAVVRSAAYLRRNNLDSGRFIYAVNMNPTVAVVPSYNMLRHAGAIYSIGMANGVAPDPDNVRVMQRAAEFLRQCCMKPLERKNMLGVFELPAGNDYSRPPEYKLGGAGLAVIALAGLANIEPASTRMDEMRGLARFGQYMQRWNGEFYAMYSPSKGGRRLPGGSLFYPGEMALGWLELYDLDREREWVDSAVKALEFLARERARSGEAPGDHWALMATARLFQISDREGIAIPRALLVEHALQICHAILDQANVPQILPEMQGALVPRGEVAPTAALLEGLLAAITFLPPDHPVTAHVDAAIHQGVEFLIRAQVKEGQFAGGMPYAIVKIPEGTADSVAAFNAQATEIRIDYVQHAMSAMVQYLGAADVHRQTSDR